MSADNGLSIEMIRGLLAEQSTVIAKSFDTQFQAFTVNVNSVLTQVSENCLHRHNSHISAMDEMSNKISTINEQLDDEPERLNRMADIVIRGIPCLNGEDTIMLSRVFQSMANVIGMDITCNPPVKILRVVTKNRSRTSPPILVKFASSDSKMLFMKKYFAKKSLSLMDIGLSSETRIYCNDNLTVRNQSLLRKAMTLKSNGLYNIFTRNGFVFCCKSKGDTTVKIVDMAQIDSLRSAGITNELLSNKSNTMSSAQTTNVAINSTAMSSNHIITQAPMPNIASNTNPDADLGASNHSHDLNLVHSPVSQSTETSNCQPTQFQATSLFIPAMPMEAIVQPHVNSAQSTILQISDVSTGQATQSQGISQFIPASLMSLITEGPSAEMIDSSNVTLRRPNGQTIIPPSQPSMDHQNV